jgi:hypothetical protein
MLGTTAEMDHSQHAQHDTGSATHIHHEHKAGQWMFEYRYMNMEMEGLLDGTESVDPKDLVAMMGGDYMMAPTEMSMDMHMLMAMYGMTSKLSLMVMANQITKNMTMINMQGMEMEMETSGQGDTLLGFMYKTDNKWTTSLSFSIPTGSIEEHVMMMGSETKAPYPMQLGSGTTDVIPAVTYSDDYHGMNWGVQAEYTYRTSENDHGYTLGNRSEVSAWIKWPMNKDVMLTTRMEAARWGNITGQDTEIMFRNMMSGRIMTPTADPNAQGGRRADFYLGLNGMFGPHMIGAEVGVPVSQTLDGPQMETKSIISVAYQYMM